MIKAALPLHDASNAVAGEQQIDPEVARLAATIDLSSALSIQQFGQEVAERSSQYADEILGTARATDLEDTGGQLNEIVLTAQQFNLSSLDNPTGRIPVIGGLLKRIARSKERAIARFDTVKGQVDKLVAQIETTAQTLSRRNHDYQLMYEGVRAEYASLGKHVEAIEMRLHDMEDEIARQNNPSGGDTLSRPNISLSSKQTVSSFRSGRTTCVFFSTRLCRPFRWFASSRQTISRLSTSSRRSAS